MYNKLFGYHCKGTPLDDDDEQNARLVPVIVILDGACHNGSNELGII